MNNTISIFTIFVIAILIGGILQFIFYVTRKNTGKVLDSNFSEASKKIALFPDEKIVLEVLKVIKGEKWRFSFFYGYNYCNVLVTNQRIILGNIYTNYNVVEIIFYKNEDYQINSAVKLLKMPYYLDNFYKGDGKTYLEIKSESLSVRNETVSISNEVLFETLSKLI